ncbi:hypothetical protein BG004_007679, partial [Podila humilis]
MYCTVRHIIIFLARLFCLVGAVWYIYRWVEYAVQGEQRPLNTLKREFQAPNSATVMPFLAITSTEPSKINVTRIQYRNTTGLYNPVAPVSSFVRYGETASDNSQQVTVVIRANLTNANDEYFEIVLQHDRDLPAYPWFKINLFARESESQKKEAVRLFTDQDIFNEYYYQPGHYVEIRYTPIEVHSPQPTKPSDNIFTRIKNYAGFAEDFVTYSYESSVSFKPFPASIMASRGYNNLTTVLMFRPQSALQFIYFTEEKTSFRDTMSSIGGLLSLAASVIAFLFGASLMSPWGKLVDMPYFRRKVAGSLAKAYASEDGISKGPFTSKIEDIGKFEQGMSSADVRITLLKERLDELELVLTEYYIEGEIFQDYASERLQIQAAKKNDALVRAATLAGQRRQQQQQAANFGSGGVGVEADYGINAYGGGISNGDIPLLPSQTTDGYRRLSISSGNRPFVPMGHTRKASESSYPQQQQQQQQLHPALPIPLPQSRSSFYEAGAGGGRGGRNQKSSSEQSLLGFSDPNYSRASLSDETEMQQQQRVSLLDQQGQPTMMAGGGGGRGPYSPPYYQPSTPYSPTYQQQHQHQQYQHHHNHSRQESSSLGSTLTPTSPSSPSSPPSLPSPPALRMGSRPAPAAAASTSQTTAAGMTVFSVIHEVSTELTPSPSASIAPLQQQQQQTQNQNQEREREKVE